MTIFVFQLLQLWPCQFSIIATMAMSFIQLLQLWLCQLSIYRKNGHVSSIAIENTTTLVLQLQQQSPCSLSNSSKATMLSLWHQVRDPQARGLPPIQDCLLDHECPHHPPDHLPHPARRVRTQQTRQVSQHCIALQCTALHRTALQCTVLHCTALHCTALNCTALHYTALHCTALYYAKSAKKCHNKKSAKKCQKGGFHCIGATAQCAGCSLSTQ